MQASTCVDPIFLDHSEEVALADLAGADQGVEVALLVAAGADIREDEIHHVVARLAPVPDLDRRNAQALSVDFPCVRIVAGGHGSADIGQMPLAHSPVAQLPLVEDRLVHAHVDRVAAAEGRIVVQDQVAFVDVVTEIARHRLHGRNQRTEMDRDVLPLQDHLRHVVEQGCRIIVRQIEDAGSRRFFERQRHLALCRLENPADHREGDRIDLGLAVLRGPRIRLLARPQPWPSIFPLVLSYPTSRSPLPPREGNECDRRAALLIRAFKASPSVLECKARAPRWHAGGTELRLDVFHKIGTID